MNILKIQNGKPIKYSEARLKQDNRNVSFPNPLHAAVLSNYDCYIFEIDPEPEYNPVLQNLNPVFEQKADGWVQSWDVVSFSEEVSINRLKNSITSDRWDMEQAGVEWLDDNADLWRISTDNNGQQKMTSVLAMLNADSSTTGYASWKMDKRITVTYIDEDEDGEDIELTEEIWQSAFRQNSLADWNQMVTLVGTHIQNCFLAEENALAKAEAGDLAVTFKSEYDKL